MSHSLLALQPTPLWKHFESLCKIPRPSEKEGQAVEYVLKFGKKHGLEAIQDKVGNVLIRKPGTPGLEDKTPVILQAHLDMVPQKNNDKEHDFEKDPIEPIIETEWVTANGTTLGADNGIGAAAMLALLEAIDVEHPPLEALFTIDEETGMTGAFGLDKDLLKGKTLINLDSETHGELYIGCAGGVDSTAYFALETEKVPGGHEAFELHVKGLKGGHSGMDINLGRGNANKLLARGIRQIEKTLAARLAKLDGGNLRNAIPREASATFLIPGSEKDKLEKTIQEYRQTIQTEFKTTDPDIKIELVSTARLENVYTKHFQEKVLKSVNACPSGVIKTDPGLKGIPETSTNLAAIKQEGKELKVLSLLRSAVDSAKDELAESMSGLFELAGAKVENTGSYPGWQPNLDSSILQTMKNIYRNEFNKEPEVKVIHAGLECGVIGGKYPGLDMISLGPTIRFPHSPDEKVHIESVKKFWQFLVHTLKKMGLCYF